MKKEILEVLRLGAQKKKSKALLSLKLLSKNAVGIGDHSTTDFYNNIEEAYQNYCEALDEIENLKNLAKEL